MKQQHLRVSGGVLLATILSFTAPAALAEGKADAVMYPSYLTLQPTVVNLADPNRPRFLRVEIDLSIKTAEDAAIVNENMPVIQDRLVVLLGGRDAKSLQAPGARDTLRKEVLEALRDALIKAAGHPAIDDLYFTGFIIQ